MTSSPKSGVRPRGKLACQSRQWKRQCIHKLQVLMPWLQVLATFVQTPTFPHSRTIAATV